MNEKKLTFYYYTKDSVRKMVKFKKQKNMIDGQFIKIIEGIEQRDDFSHFFPAHQNIFDKIYKRHKLKLIREL